jgi:hypothetical protein
VEELIYTVNTAVLKIIYNMEGESLDVAGRKENLWLNSMTWSSLAAGLPAKM